MNTKAGTPCAPTACTRCQWGQPGLEGPVRRRYHQAGDLQSPARVHRAVPQRRPPHPGGPARHHRGPFTAGLHLCAHLPADPAGNLRPGVHHRPHRSPMPRLSSGGAVFLRRGRLRQSRWLRSAPAGVNRRTHRRPWRFLSCSENSRGQRPRISIPARPPF